MKENEQRPGDIFLSIITALQAAEDANVFIFWRDKFKVNHPKHNPEEINNLEQWQEANYVAAKHLYCLHKDRMDSMAEECFDDPSVVSPSKSQCAMIMALRQSVEQEMVEQVEGQLLNQEEDPQGYWEGDEYLPVPESISHY